MKAAVVRTVVLASLLVACGLGGGGLIAVTTQDPVLPFVERGCPAATGHGTLVSDVRWGVALRLSTDQVTKVLWPHGYAARGPAGSRELLDANRNVIALEGQFVELGGGFSRGDTEFLNCGGITVLPDGVP